MADSTIEQSITYARENREMFLDQFNELLRIPSISADPTYKDEVQRAADWIEDEMTRIGLANCQAIKTEGHPVVYGEWLDAGEGKPTILVYAHYDVQPVDPLDLWESPPFEPSIRQGKLYARGSIDDKCGVIVNLKAVESMLKTTGNLPVNLKFFFEGEEESGSPSMEPFVKSHKDLLDADLLIISDGGSEKAQPKVFTSLRGIVTVEVNVSGPKRDLHSGSYGGVVHNPAHMVSQMIAAIHDDEGRILIPGYYDHVKLLSSAQQENLKNFKETTISRAIKDTGREIFWGVPEYTFLERQTAQPTFDINGLYSGYHGPGGKTIIPAEAGFKASMRLVVDQDPDDIAQKFTDFIDSFSCDTIDIEVKIASKSWPVEVLFNEPPVEAIQRAYEATWGKRALLYRQGGSVPIVGMFQRELGMPISNLGFGNGDNGHAPNEFYRLEYFYRSIDTAIHFYHYIVDAL